MNHHLAGALPHQSVGKLQRIPAVKAPPVVNSKLQELTFSLSQRQMSRLLLDVACALAKPVNHEENVSHRFEWFNRQRGRFLFFR
jgi:hypothetical protein